MNRNIRDALPGRVSGPSFHFGRAIVSLVVIAGIVIVAIGLLVVSSQAFYLFKQVKEDEIGVQIRGGQIVNILPPGIYSDVGLYVRLETYSTQEYKFTSNDPEVITLDQQRIGVTVSGSVFRPGLGDEPRVMALWTQYKSLYTSDDSLQRKMDDLSMQAMKVCVGDRPFQDSVIGSDRDTLRGCIDNELNNLAKPYGLTVQNLVVPNVTLNPEVQAKMDAITQSRLDTEKAQQDEQKAIAQGKASQAEQEAAIRVEQSRKQEETRQQTTLAQLEQAKLKAQQAVIEAQKANDLLSAQKDLEIARAKAAAAGEQAKADLAQQTALAALYTQHPEYVQVLLAQTNAGAIKDTDKLIFTTTGTFPNLVFGNALPTFNLPNQPTVTTEPTTPAQP